MIAFCEVFDKLGFGITKNLVNTAQLWVESLLETNLILCLQVSENGYPKTHFLIRELRINRYS